MTRPSRIQELRRMLDGVTMGEYPSRTIDPEPLIIDQRIYPRTGINMDRVGQMREAVQEGVAFPPILLAQDERTIVDGVHRTLAYREEGKELLAIALPVQTITDVILLSMLANTPAGGLPLGSGDLQRGIGLLIEEFKKDGKTPAEGMKTIGGSMPVVAGNLGISTKRLNNFLAALTEEKPERRVPPTARRRDEPPPEPQVWDPPMSTMAPAVIEAVLKVPAVISAVPVSSPYDSLVAGILKTVIIYRAIDPDGPDSLLAGLRGSLRVLSREDRLLLNTHAFADLRTLASMLANAFMSLVDSNGPPTV